MENNNKLKNLFLILCVFIYILPFSVHAEVVWTKNIGGYAFNGNEQTIEANAILNSLSTYSYKGAEISGGSSYRNSWYRFSANNGGFFTLDGTNIGSNITIIHKEDWVGVAKNLCAGWGNSSFWGEDSTPINDSNCIYYANWRRSDKTLAINSPTPIPPSSFFATSTNQNTIVLSWTDTSTNETSFKIYRNSNGTSQLIIVGSNLTTYQDGNLAPGTYTYSISSCTEMLCSSSATSYPVVITSSATTTGLSGNGGTTSTTTSGTTGANTTSTTPSSPTYFTATRLYTNSTPTNSIKLTWIDNSNNETYFRINRSSSNGTSQLPAVSTNMTSYEDNNLPNGNYTYYLSACTDTRCSSPIPSSVVNLGTSSGGISGTSIQTTNIATTDTTNIQANPTPVAPTNGTAVRIYENSSITNSIRISWIDNSNNETRFRIYRSSASDAVELPAVNSNQTSYNDNNLPAGNYTYYIASCINEKCSTNTITNSVTIATQIQNVATTTNTNILDNTTEQNIEKNKSIRGRIINSEENPVNDAEVGAYNSATSKWISDTTDEHGYYDIKVTTGIWNVIIRPKNQSTALWTASDSNNLFTFYNASTTESKELNMTVNTINSNIMVKIVDEDGNPIPNIGVVFDTVSSKVNNTTTDSSQRKIRTEKTNTMGTITLRTPKGIYYIRTSFGDGLSYLETPEEKVVLDNNDTKTVYITLKKEVSNYFVLLTGTTKFDDGTPTSGFVFAWSDEGGHEQVRTATNGVFTLQLTKNQTWHIGASKDVTEKSFSSTVQTFDAISSNKSIELIFVKNDSTPLSPPVKAKKEITEQVTISSDDGAKFSLPPNSVDSNGKIDVEIKPTAEAVSQSASVVMGNAYDITIKDTNGQKLTKLSQDAEILLPYDEAELKASGVVLENVIPSYYDESINTWVSVSKFIIDKNRKVFVLYVNHLTRFALIAAADTTPPPSPTGIVTDAITPTDIKISWKNTSPDINHAKIYRSEKLGVFGNIIAAEVFSTSFIDKTFGKNNKTYYYTVRSVDAAGNESNNSNQIAFTTTANKFTITNATSSLLLPKGQESAGEISRTLSLGSKGDDVTLLQRALKSDGFYATGPITGYYGKRTENAVFRFQNYYKKELLIPNGYSKGTGVLGAITRKKINEIIVKNNL